MGALTQCNRCTLEQYKRRAKKDDLRISLLPGSRRLGGVSVYMHHESVTKTALKKSRHLRERYFVAWLMEVSEECTCG